MNLGATLGVYAALCKEEGVKFAYPGSVSSWQCLLDFTDASLIAKMFAWAAMTNSAWNNAFNVVNGDQWRYVGSRFIGRRVNNTADGPSCGPN
jgi:hypothetical protein